MFFRTPKVGKSWNLSPKSQSPRYGHYIAVFGHFSCSAKSASKIPEMSYGPKNRYKWFFSAKSSVFRDFHIFWIFQHLCSSKIQKKCKKPILKIFWVLKIRKSGFRTHLMFLAYRGVKKSKKYENRANY